MNERIRRPIKALIATIVCIIVMFIGLAFSLVIFQGHIHPDDWVATWQDKTIVGLVGLVYLGYLYKMSKEPFESKRTKSNLK